MRCIQVTFTRNIATAAEVLRKCKEVLSNLAQGEQRIKLIKKSLPITLCLSVRMLRMSISALGKPCREKKIEHEAGKERSIFFTKFFFSFLGSLTCPESAQKGTVHSRIDNHSQHSPHHLEEARAYLHQLPPSDLMLQLFPSRRWPAALPPLEVAV